MLPRFYCSRDFIQFILALASIVLFLSAVIIMLYAFGNVFFTNNTLSWKLSLFFNNLFSAIICTLVGLGLSSILKRIDNS